MPYDDDVAKKKQPRSVVKLCYMQLLIDMICYKKQTSSPLAPDRLILLLLGKYYM